VLTDWMRSGWELGTGKRGREEGRSRERRGGGGRGEEAEEGPRPHSIFSSSFFFSLRRGWAGRRRTEQEQEHTRSLGARSLARS
jgi:hypothetical protein